MLKLCTSSFILYLLRIFRVYLGFFSFFIYPSVYFFSIFAKKHILLIHRNNNLIRNCLTAAIFFISTLVTGQIRLNQVGLYPMQEKIAVIEGLEKETQFEIIDAGTGNVVQKADVIRTSISPWSKKERTIIDFSSLAKSGDYVLKYKDESAVFTITPNAYHSLACSVLKAFYLNRSGMAIERQYAGVYARPTGHPDTLVYIHSSAATPERPEGTVISSPFGWYDAGDFNKYIVNSAFSVGIILASYEQNKEYFDRLDVNIPESSNHTSDLLDEMMYNLKWMLTMQDPFDGGVYHKLTTPSFESFVMPYECKQKRYVVQKSTAATLDFAAVMAQAARIYKNNTDYPQFSEQATKAALFAFDWAERFPDKYYQQWMMNQQYEPDVSTGDYGDRNLDDEWFWAATELYLLTGEGRFDEMATSHQPRQYSAPSWGNVRALGTYEWVMLQPQSPLAQICQRQMLDACDRMIQTTQTSSFHTPNGNSPREFGWGCLAGTFCANGLSFLYAYRLMGDDKYLKAAQQDVDYVFGRNATGYCYVTGFGKKSPMHPHHRISASDSIQDPFPGMLVGGPNPRQQDIKEVKAYPSSQPDESYIDVTDSYASNEIAINWNASLLAFIGWLENEQK